MNIDFFVNDRFRVISYLYDISNSDKKSYVTQRELALALNISLSFTNKIIQELKNNNFLEKEKDHNGRYTLTQEAISVVKQFKNLNK